MTDPGHAASEPDDAIVSALAKALLVEPTLSNAEEIDSRIKDARAKDAEQDVKLKKLVAGVSLGLVGGQIAITDAIFWGYGMKGGWHISDAVILGWMSSTVVECVGVLVIITRSLFPNRDSGATR